MVGQNKLVSLLNHPRHYNLINSALKVKTTLPFFVQTPRVARAIPIYNIEYCLDGAQVFGLKRSNERLVKRSLALFATLAQNLQACIINPLVLDTNF